jgi:hypothetical protein
VNPVPTDPIGAVTDPPVAEALDSVVDPIPSDPVIPINLETSDPGPVPGGVPADPVTTDPGPSKPPQDVTHSTPGDAAPSDSVPPLPSNDPPSGPGSGIISPPGTDSGPDVPMSGADETVSGHVEPGEPAASDTPSATAGDTPNAAPSDPTLNLVGVLPGDPLLLNSPLPDSSSGPESFYTAAFDRTIRLLLAESKPMLDGFPRWLPASVAHVSPPTGTTVPSAPERSPLPPQPGGMAGSAGISSSLLLLSSLAALLVMFSAAFPRFTRRLDAVPASWRPMPLLSLLERPG